MASPGILAAPIRRFLRILLWIFFRRIEVAGEAYVPARGPLVVAANHHNSIVDAMLLLALLPRPLRVLAKDGLFRHPLIGPFLKGIGALPVRRRQEHGDDPGRNAGLFAETTSALRAGGGILIFPEGRTQPEPVLLELRTGAARMLLEAEAPEETLGATLLPVGLVFENPGVFREGRALVNIGPPVPSADLVDLARRDPEEAARALTGRLSESLRALILEAPDRETLRLLALLEALAGPEAARGGLATRLPWLRAAMDGYRRLKGTPGGDLEAFVGRLRAFDAELEALGLEASRIRRGWGPWSLAGRALRDLLVLGLGAPFALAGILLHGLPYLATRAAVRRIPHTDEEEGTDKIAAGLLFYPLFWLTEAWGARALGGWPLVAWLVAAIAPTAFFALAWQERLSRLSQRLRWLRRLAASGSRLEALRREREALSRDLVDLARRAFPEPSLSGDAP